MSSFWASLSTTKPSQSQQDANELAEAQATAAAAAAAASQSSLFSQSSVGSQLFGSAPDHHAEHNEVCLTCGSTDFLTDDATGVTVCAQCHTQSQTLSQVEVVGEEDVEALAARTGKGRMVSRRIGGKRKLASVEEIDNSAKLPGVGECLGGFQYLLREAAECAADLVGLVEPNGDGDDDDDDVNDGRQVLIDTVGNIWFGYLTSWREGAKKNSRLHPEVRFSLRDAFLGENRRGMVLRHLSARCCEEIRAEEERLDRISKKSGKGRGQKRRRDDQQSPSPNANTSTGQDRQIFGSVAALLDSFPSDQIDDQIAALRLVPSLPLNGSIIHPPGPDGDASGRFLPPHCWLGRIGCISIPDQRVPSAIAGVQAYAETDEELLHSDFAPSGTAGLSGRHLGDCLRDEIGAVVKLTRER